MNEIWPPAIRFHATTTGDAFLFLENLHFASVLMRGQNPKWEITIWGCGESIKDLRARAIPGSMIADTIAPAENLPAMSPEEF